MTPQLFLEAIRSWIIANNTLITEEEKEAIAVVPIQYKATSQDPLYVVERCIGRSIEEYGLTDKVRGLRADFVQIFGYDAHCNALHVAFTLVHELGHVIMPDMHGENQHGPEWADCAMRLGICEVPYEGTLKNLNTKPESWKWAFRDKALEAYIRTLPTIEWGNTEVDAATLLEEEWSKIQPCAYKYILASLLDG